MKASPPLGAAVNHTLSTARTQSHSIQPRSHTKMSYTKNYYDILRISAPSPGTNVSQSDLDLRKAYKIALLAVHPDKQTSTHKGADTATKRNAYSVDDVKEAYTVLSDARKRREYNEFLLRNPALLRGDGMARDSGREGNKDGDFVLGLELLDLSDFDEEEVRDGHAGGESGRVEWTRRCRCGNERGFRIIEEELEDAEKSGEKEVLVGCEGCSLWVRVGFEVEEG